ncbi:MAG: S41 family peptidase [Verrucomicrobiales bacterium]
MSFHRRLFLLGSAAILTFAGGLGARDDAESDDSGFEEIELFTEVLETIRQGYVDSEKATYEKLINSALEGMLAALDPHCQFMQPKVFEQLKRHTDSTYEGIGVTISTKNDVLTIVTVREDGPAARAGLLPGDQILKINNQLTEDIGISQAVNMLRGKPGESLKLTARRPATQKLHEFDMKREVIKQSTVKDVRILGDDLTAPYRMGYARILQFSESTADELADALDELEQEGMDAFVLDMRNNPGGLLGSAIDVCGEFVEAGTVVLTTEGKPGSGEIKVYRTKAERKRRPRDYPLAILINHSSASGAEVVAGALQDLKRCIVVGETSFGKGSVQSILPIGEGKAIRMTTAKYYTPSHRTIHENGVVPNIVAPLTPSEEQELARWFSRDTLDPEERKKADGFRDSQMIRGIDAMKGALVYSDIRQGEVPATAAAGESGDEEDRGAVVEKRAADEPEAESEESEEEAEDEDGNEPSLEKP